jgi:hypothetical protein
VKSNFSCLVVEPEKLSASHPIYAHVNKAAQTIQRTWNVHDRHHALAQLLHNQRINPLRRHQLLLRQLPRNQLLLRQVSTRRIRL